MTRKREIIEITGGSYRALINVSEGANCICLENVKYGADLLRQPDYSAGIDNPFLYGMPILFPVNRIHAGRFRFEGREYTFPINEPKTGCHLHGELHAKPFTVDERTKSSVICSYDSGTERLGFPHQFHVTLAYSLSDAGLSLKTEIANHSGLNMPVLLGFHTTFNVPFLKNGAAENVRVTADVGDEVVRSTDRYLPTGEILPYTHTSALLNAGAFKPHGNPISLHYQAAGEGRIILTDVESGISVVYDNDAKFGWRLFYNGNADQFICLEPQTCMVNCLESGLDDSYTGFDFIAPFSKKVFDSSIFLKKIS